MYSQAVMDCQVAAVFMDGYDKVEATACWMDRSNREERRLFDNPIYQAALIEGCLDAIQDLYPQATDINVNVNVQDKVYVNFWFHEEVIGTVRECVALDYNISIAAAYRSVVYRLIYKLAQL